MIRAALALVTTLGLIAPTQDAAARVFDMDMWYCPNQLTCSPASALGDTFHIDTNGTFTGDSGITGTWSVAGGTVRLLIDGTPRTSYYQGTFNRRTRCISGTLVFGFTRGSWGGCLVP